jgi:hypothetical protein
MATNRSIKLGKWDISEDEILRELADARKAGEESLRNDPHAKHVYFDKEMRRVVIETTDGVLLAIPYKKIQGLQNATAYELHDVHIMGQGSAIRWEQLDVDMGVAELWAGLYGTKRWMRELATKGGRARTEAKITAARANGTKGGRPRQNKVSTLPCTIFQSSVFTSQLSNCHPISFPTLTINKSEVDLEAEVRAIDFTIAEEKLASQSFRKTKFKIGSGVMTIPENWAPIRVSNDAEAAFALLDEINEECF